MHHVPKCSTPPSFMCRESKVISKIDRMGRRGPGIKASERFIYGYSIPDVIWAQVIMIFMFFELSS